jgi:hypothetical protein
LPEAIILHKVHEWPLTATFIGVVGVGQFIDLVSRSKQCWFLRDR